MFWEELPIKRKLFAQEIKIKKFVGLWLPIMNMNYLASILQTIKTCKRGHQEREREEWTLSIKDAG
jgi:hypothetical protein